jgi:hypothetical protein
MDGFRDDVISFAGAGFSSGVGRVGFSTGGTFGFLPGIAPTNPKPRRWIVLISAFSGADART